MEIGKLLSANQIVVGSIGETLTMMSEKYNKLDSLLDDAGRLAEVFALEGMPGTEAPEVETAVVEGGPEERPVQRGGSLDLSAVYCFPGTYENSSESMISISSFSIKLGNKVDAFAAALSVGYMFTPFIDEDQQAGDYAFLQPGSVLYYRNFFLSGYLSGFRDRNDFSIIPLFGVLLGYSIFFSDEGVQTFFKKMFNP